MNSTDRDPLTANALIELLNRSNSVPEMFYYLVAHRPEEPAYIQCEVTNWEHRQLGDRGWEAASFAKTGLAVDKLVEALNSTEIHPGERIAILANTRGEWLVADLAIMSAGGVAVSIFPSLPSNDIGFILADAEISVVFAENQEQVDKLLSLQGTEIHLPEIEGSPARDVKIELRRIFTFESCHPDPLITYCKEIVREHKTDSNDPEVLPSNQQLTNWESKIQSFSNLKREDIATVVYTSGTSGPMKGVLQSHSNHLANVRQALESGVLRPDSTIMLILPLAHSFARLMGYIGVLTTARVFFPAVIDRTSSTLIQKSITRDLKEANAQIIPVVPRLLERMQAGILEQSQAKSVKGFLVRCCLHSAWGNSRLLRSVTRPLRRSIRRTLFGNNFLFAISGGAKLPIGTAQFFAALEILVLEGYGLTETAVATNINRPWGNRIGTVGPVLGSDIEIRIAEDGEILIRGPNVAKGYLNRPQSTATAWDKNGWFHTGDLGSLSDDGYLSVTGRKKEILVFSTGKKISPLLIEELLSHSSLVDQVVICGDGRPYCVALIVPHDLENLKQDNLKLAQVEYAISKEVERVNCQLPPFATIKKFKLLLEPFSVNNGLLTPTFKIKRSAVDARYSKEINSLFYG